MPLVHFLYNATFFLSGLNIQILKKKASNSSTSIQVANTPAGTTTGTTAGTMVKN